MPETNPNPIAEVEGFEARVFRAGQVARRLIADHIDLPLRSVRLTTAVNEVQVRLLAEEIRPWAAAYGVELTTRHNDDGDAVFVHLTGEAVVDGCPVEFAGCRMLTGAAAAAWRAEQAAHDEWVRCSGPGCNRVVSRASWAAESGWTSVEPGAWLCPECAAAAPELQAPGGEGS